MDKLRRNVSAAEFVRTSELLDSAFPKADAVPDYLLHECEKAEQALLGAIGKKGVTRDAELAAHFGLSLETKRRRRR